VLNFSIIIPVYNESQNIEKLVIEIFNSLKKFKKFELIFINDGSKDRTLKVLNKLKKKYKKLSYISNRNNLGQSYSILKGIKNSNFDTIITLDGDGQNNPKDISRLLNIFFKNKNISLVSGIRKKRKDSFIKIISSRFANNIRSFILRDGCRDTGCSLKVFDKKTFLSFPFFNGIHRFLPALYIGYGKKVKYIDVDHRPRIAGISKYGTALRFFRGIRDLIKVIIIIRKHNSKND